MSNPAASHTRPADARRQSVCHAVEHAAHLLPAQGPIGVFIHHNTLHAFQHLHFEDAVREASKVFGTEPFLREDVYRQHLRDQRIQVEDIHVIVGRESNDAILPNRLDRRTLREQLLIAGQRRFEPATVQWHLDETDLLQRLRAGANREFAAKLCSGPGEEAGLHELFAACRNLAQPEPASVQPAARVRDALLQSTGVDLDQVVHPLLIRLSGAFHDQGMAYWPMPSRHRGFLKCVRALMTQGWSVFPEHLGDLGTEFRRQADRGLDAAAVVMAALEHLGVPQAEWDATIQAELLALPGWAGIMYRLEVEPELAPHERVPCSLLEYLAVRLTIVTVAARNISKSTGASLKAWRKVTIPAGCAQAEGLAEAARLFDAFQLLGLSAADIHELSSILRQRLVDEIRSFHELERRRILHLAYERRHEIEVLGPLASYRQSHPPVLSKPRPSAQVFFCIDEREESMRRHLEEVAPDVETHSAAGFFGVAMEYAGIDDAHGVPLCPVVVKPKHATHERPVSDHQHLYEARRTRRKRLAKVVRGTFVSSRSLVRGWASTAGFGLLSMLPLATRVLAPLHYGRSKKAFHKRFLPQPITELNFTREDEQAQLSSQKLLQGFTTVEKIDRVAGMLGPVGLRDDFARMVVILGHGSTSLNNPHESAHDCGACGGRRGGPNGRIFAAMANRPEVREGLRARGIHIPEDTWFVGGYHDTCNDDVDLYDLESIPETHRADLERIRTSLNRARSMDAVERVRRFEAARANGDPQEALRHVQDRAEQLAEPRPEYGHATNAVCIVGRRSVTRGLFLDRRAFLISYDATKDPENRGLAALMGAAGPVCAGISLEYYFSYVDNEGYGCGTKLPHNITGLIGVMNGPASDLRTGLPLQMVEVHEPVRILFVLESTPERVMQVISANAELTELVEKRWVRLATLDPDTGRVHVRRDHGFEEIFGAADGPMCPLPSAATSVDWFLGKLQHLPIARIEGYAQG